MTWNLFKKHRPSKKPSRHSARPKSRPGVESLEERALLAFSPIAFTLNPASSSLALSGTIRSGTTINNLMTQGAGSLSTTFNGTVAVGYDPAANTICFLPNTATPGTNLVANNSGSWRPTAPPNITYDPQPANYGGVVDLVFGGQDVRLTTAVRELTATLATSTPLSLSGGPNLFTFSSTQAMTLTGGRADYMAHLVLLFPAFSVAADTLSLANETGNNQSPTAGSIEDLGNGSYRLTVPIRFSIVEPDLEGQELILTTTGTMVGTAVLPVVDLNGPAAGADFVTAAQVGGSDVALMAPTATVTRTPAANLVSATIRVVGHPDEAAETLEVNVGASGLSSSGYNPVEGTLTVSGTASAAVYEQVLRTLTYRNFATAGADYANRVIEISVSDGTNSSLVRTTTVALIPPVTGGLTVGSFTALPSGFTARLSRPLDVSVLSIYDTATGTLGAADVTVVGATTGAVQGSVIIHPGNSIITFVRTGGVMLADDYTVTFRSAANGFKDLAGSLLDGDADGTPGGNFVQNYNVAASGGVVLSVPDVARGAGQSLDASTTAAGIPVTLSDGTGVTSVSFDLLYDPRLFTVTGFTRGTLPGSTRVTLDGCMPGLARVTISGSTALATGPVVLGRLTGTVPDTASYGAKQRLNLENVQVNSTFLTNADDDGVHIAAYLGDATGNGRYSSADATLLLRLGVGLGDGVEAYQLGDARVFGDITGDRRISAIDSTRVLQEAVGIDQASIPPLPGLVNIPTSGPDPFLNIPKAFLGQRGRTITVPVRLDLSDGLESADLAISYDTRRLDIASAEDVQRGSLTDDFDVFLVNLDRQAGTVRVGLGRVAGPLQGQGSGSVLRITFTVKPDAPRGRAIINLRENVDSTFTALNEGGLDLIPDPSNRAGDILDGQILVLPQLPPRASELIDRINSLLADLLERLPPPTTATAPAAVATSTLVQQVDRVFQNPAFLRRPDTALVAKLRRIAGASILSTGLDEKPLFSFGR